ncbi:hypothetical protein FRB96_002124 [Tulasnella sp. 330]|nr:hypothetical protein FRB96_002124 [Tulasnella sp. 330]KAG8879223.1 hypothetical protein FRB97_001842 [Tulasnella sp. 331]KAG8885289.1 hypothetical protein FRB98_001874 [Tulasnella sp. 332]
MGQRCSSSSRKMNSERDHDLPPRPTAATTTTTAATTNTKGPSPSHQMIIQQHQIGGGAEQGEKMYDLTSSRAAAPATMGDLQCVTSATTTTVTMNARPMKPLPRSKRRRTGDGLSGINGSDDDAQGGDIGILNGVNGRNAVLGSFPMQLQYHPSGGAQPVAFGASPFGTFAAGATPVEVHVDDGALSDSDDHRREERDHQGNTKKRKVPAAAHHHFRNGSSGEDDIVALPGGGGESGGRSDERYGRDDFDSEPRTLDAHHRGTNGSATTAISTGSVGGICPPALFGSTNAPLTAKQRASIPAATAVHMLTKEIVRKRRRLMVGILPPNAEITPEQEIAIVQALSDPTLNWTLRGQDATKPLVDSRAREIRRKIVVLRRKLREMNDGMVGGRCGMPQCTFTLSFPNPASERMRQLLEAVAAYKDRFQVELARLATVKRIAGIASPAPSGGVDAKRGQAGSRKKMTTTTTTTTTTNGNTTTTTTTTYSKSGVTPGLGMNDVNGHQQLNGSGTGNGKNTPNGNSNNGNSNGGGSANGHGKKNKKRTSNSKASDPHRTGNYIPSRLPTAAGVPPSLTPAQAAASLATLISPLPVRLLSADVPDTPSQRRRRRQNQNINPKTNSPYITSSLPPVQPELEWICPFCEYDLFFGGEEQWRKAVRARKKLLSRRRRARERAAMAASGQSMTRSLKKRSGRGGGGGEDVDEEEEEEDILNQEARFEDPEAVEARVNANVRSVLKDKDKGGGFNVDGIGAGVGVAS